MTITSFHQIINKFFAALCPEVVRYTKDSRHCEQFLGLMTKRNKNNTK